MKILLVNIVQAKDAKGTAPQEWLLKLGRCGVLGGLAWLVGRAAFMGLQLMITIQLIYSLMISILLA